MNTGSMVQAQTFITYKHACEVAKSTLYHTIFEALMHETNSVSNVTFGNSFFLQQKYSSNCLPEYKCLTSSF